MWNSQLIFLIFHSGLNSICLCFCSLYPSWTISQEHFRLAGRTGFGGTCPRCRVALGSESSTFSPGPSSFLRTSSCSARPGRTVAPGRNGLSNLYVLLVNNHFNLNTHFTCNYSKAVRTLVSHIVFFFSHLYQPASARGIGIQVIHKWSQMPRKRPLLVQKWADFYWFETRPEVVY